MMSRGDSLPYFHDLNQPCLLFTILHRGEAGDLLKTKLSDIWSALSKTRKSIEYLF